MNAEWQQFQVSKIEYFQFNQCSPKHVQYYSSYMCIGMHKQKDTFMMPSFLS